MASLLLSVPGLVSAGDYTYVTDNGTFTITGYIGSGGAVAIPLEISGLPVVSIGAPGMWPGAFAGRTKLTSITIPDTVTRIAEQTFYDCTGLASVKGRLAFATNVLTSGWSYHSDPQWTTYHERFYHVRRY